MPANPNIAYSLLSEVAATDVRAGFADGPAARPYPLSRVRR